MDETPKTDNSNKKLPFYNRPILERELNFLASLYKKYFSNKGPDLSDSQFPIKNIQTLTGAKAGDVILGFLLSGLLLMTGLWSIGLLFILGIIAIASGKKYFLYGILVTVIVIGIMFGAYVMMLSRI